MLFVNEGQERRAEARLLGVFVEEVYTDCDGHRRNGRVVDHQRRTDPWNQ